MADQHDGSCPWSAPAEGSRTDCGWRIELRRIPAHSGSCHHPKNASRGLTCSDFLCLLVACKHYVLGPPKGPSQSRLSPPDARPAVPEQWAGRLARRGRQSRASRDPLNSFSYVRKSVATRQRSLAKGIPPDGCWRLAVVERSPYDLTGKATFSKGHGALPHRPGAATPATPSVYTTGEARAAPFKVSCPSILSKPAEHERDGHRPLVFLRTS